MRPAASGNMITKDLRGKFVSLGKYVYLVDLSGKAKELITEEMLPGIRRELKPYERAPQLNPKIPKRRLF